MSPEIVALLGVIASIIVRVWSNHRTKLLETELDDARDREIELERNLHTAHCQLARHGLAAECPLHKEVGSDQDHESEAR